MKRIVTLTVSLVSFLFAMANDEAILAISADGQKVWYKLENVRTITFDDNEDSFVVTEENDNQTDGFLSIIFTEKKDGVGLPDALSFQNIQIYPNPVQHTLHIRNLKENDVVYIFSTDGRLILQSSEQEINVSHLAPNQYILRIGNNSLKFTKK